MKHKAIPKKIREIVYNKFGGHCAYCGCKLDYKDMQVDHAYSVYWSSLDEAEKAKEKDGRYHSVSEHTVQDDSIDNLMPSCRQCNLYKGDYDIENFRKSIKETLSRTCLQTFQSKLAVKYGILTFHEWNGKFFFEKWREDNEKQD